MSWIVTWNLNFESNDGHHELVHRHDYLTERVRTLKDSKFVTNLRLYKVEKEIDISVESPDFYGYATESREYFKKLFK